jgi:transposase
MYSENISMPFISQIMKGCSMDVDVQSYNIGHLGIVAGIFDDLKIAEVIDRALPKQGSRNLPHSIAAKAMILNGLGFTHQRLYLFPNFFMTIPTEKLLGEDITPSALNDDAVGRTLDAIYEYDATELFNEITLQVMKNFSLGTQLVHVDTTNFSVQGKYENDAPDGTDSIRITFGHAKDDAKIWASAHPIHLIKKLQVLLVAKKVEKRRGRPKKDEPIEVSFRIEAEIDLNADALNDKRGKLGRFVLVSNDTGLDPEVMLNYYKGQQTVERGFRFLKDKCFHVSEVYLKKEERIEALSMIMVLSLLIYSFAEWRLREKLKETGQTVPNQLNKPTQRPTMRWIFEIFMGVIQAVVTSAGKVIKVIVNLNSTQVTILKLLGNGCENYYGVN